MYCCCFDYFAAFMAVDHVSLFAKKRVSSSIGQKWVIVLQIVYT